jgi:uncharacterized surface protein with fasciclin (FAS1) repeats
MMLSPNCPKGTIDALLADIPQLTDILLYHVVSGKVMAADVVGLDGRESCHCSGPGSRHQG